jgi:ribosomal protein S18 acetylase RimI-like enzyme
MAHFVYNASLYALPMLRSGEPYFVFSGTLVLAAMLAPVLPGLARRARRALDRATADPPPALRLATPADLEEFLRLPVAGIDWETLLKDPNACVLRLGLERSSAWAEGQPPGHDISKAHPFKTIGAAAGVWKEPGQAEVLAVWVAPEWRGQFWGSRLTEALLKELQAKGATEVRVSVPAGDRRALSFWASQGWRVSRQVLEYAPVPQFSELWRGWRAAFRNRGFAGLREGKPSHKQRPDNSSQ